MESLLNDQIDVSSSISGSSPRKKRDSHHRRSTSSVSDVLSVDSMQDLALPDEERFIPRLQTLYSVEVTDDMMQDDPIANRADRNQLRMMGEENDDDFMREEWMMRERGGGGGGGDEGDEYEDDYEDYEEEDLEQEEEERKEGDHVATRVSFAPRVVTAVHHIDPYRTEDLPALFYSEREILLLQMEAEGPLPNDDDEGGPPSLSSGGEARIETIVFSDSDDGF